MIKVPQQIAAQKYCGNAKILYPKDIHQMLTDICEQNAIYWGSSKKKEAISHIRYGLKSCEFSTNDFQIIQTCLNLKSHFLTLIVCSGATAHKKYFKTILALMDACKAFLNTKSA